MPHPPQKLNGEHFKTFPIYRNYSPKEYRRILYPPAYLTLPPIIFYNSVISIVIKINLNFYHKALTCNQLVSLNSIPT